MFFFKLNILLVLNYRQNFLNFVNDITLYPQISQSLRYMSRHIIACIFFSFKISVLGLCLFFVYILTFLKLRHFLQTMCTFNALNFILFSPLKSFGHMTYKSPLLIKEIYQVLAIFFFFGCFCSLTMFDRRCIQTCMC